MHRPSHRRPLHAALLAALALVGPGAGALAAPAGAARAADVPDPAASVALEVAPGDRTAVGVALTLTARVDDAAGVPVTDGEVRFSVDDEVVAEVALDGTGRAVATATPARGAHVLRAAYAGRPDLLGSEAARAHSVLPEVCPEQAVPGAGAVVRHVYLVVLARCPEPEGFAHWTGALAAGTPAAAVARAVAAAPEARAALVEQAYRTVLRRPSDPGGRAVWVDALRRGWSLPRLWTALAASSEMAQTAGTGGLVAAAYDRLLGRPADAADLAYWEGRLAGAASRAAVLRALVGSTEALGHVAGRAHTDALGRAPSPAEAAAAVADARRRGDWRPLVPRLLGTPEAGAHAGTYPDPPAAG